MNIAINVLVAVLGLLAIASGSSKLMLMQQEVEFFGAYGFTNLMLVLYGVAQVIGGVLLIIPKTRIYGAAIVAVTFLVSAVVLVLAGNFTVAIITVVATLLLGVIIRHTQKRLN
jgi:uncharacterized membrane protein YphA (DoxX/SURF4 family)